jgi:O-antigen biosynthesis protein
VAHLTASRFGACTPLRVYSAPNDTLSRVSVVTDSINDGSLDGAVSTAIIMSALLAEARQARLRFITRTERAQPRNLENILSMYGINLPHEVEFEFAPFHDHKYEISVFDNEIFVTTSWWTTAAMMESVRHDAIVYLLQEDERKSYPYGDDHLRCAQLLHTRTIHFVINTRLLFGHFIGEGLTNVAERGVWFEPAFPKKIFYPRNRSNSQKQILIFYARPNNLCNLFYFGIELLELAVKRGIIDLAKWDIMLIGSHIPSVTFGNNYVPEKRENLSWGEYAELLGKVDLGLCLMYTPHPSYPPLDLAASGAVAVTNRFGNKQDLHNYSPNIICGDLDLESMSTVLRKGIALSTNIAERTENYRFTTLGSDWRLAFSEVIENFSKPQ